MKSIWKFPLELESRQTIPMPIGAEVLSVDAQRGQICVWALVDAEHGAKSEPREFFILGTGHPAHEKIDSSSFIGTVLTEGGNFVWHIFGK